MKGFLGNDDLGGFDQQSRLLLLNYTIFLFVSAGVGIFVNLYLWVNSLDINDLIEYQLFSSLTVMPGFLVMLKYASRLRNADIYRLGIVAYILFIATLIVLQEKSVYYSWLLGVESGIAAGFLYAGYNSLTYQEINQKNRILFNSWRSLFSNAVGILAPFVLGFIIVFFNHRGGYLIAYVVLLGILLYQLLNSMKITGNDHKSRIRLGSSFKIAFSNKNYPYIAGADVFWTMTGVIRGIVISIFLFISSCASAHRSATSPALADPEDPTLSMIFSDSFTLFPASSFPIYLTNCVLTFPFTLKDLYSSRYVEFPAFLLLIAICNRYTYYRLINFTVWKTLELLAG